MFTNMTSNSFFFFFIFRKSPLTPSQVVLAAKIFKSRPLARLCDVYFLILYSFASRHLRHLYKSAVKAARDPQLYSVVKEAEKVDQMS